MKSLKYFIIIFLIYTVSISANDKKTNTINPGKLYKEAVKFYNEKNYEKAKENFSKLCENYYFEKDVRIFYYYGKCLYELKDLQKSIFYFERFTKYTGEYTELLKDTYLISAKIYESGKKNESCLKMLMNYIEITNIKNIKKLLKDYPQFSKTEQAARLIQLSKKRSIGIIAKNAKQIKNAFINKKLYLDPFTPSPGFLKFYKNNTFQMIKPGGGAGYVIYGKWSINNSKKLFTIKLLGLLYPELEMIDESNFKKNIKQFHANKVEAFGEEAPYLALFKKPFVEKIPFKNIRLNQKEFYCEGMYTLDNLVIFHYFSGSNIIPHAFGIFDKIKDHPLED